MWAQSVHLMSMSSLFFVVVFLIPPGSPFLENTIGDKLGELSYSLYLLHAPVFAVLQPRFEWGSPGCSSPWPAACWWQRRRFRSSNHHSDAESVALA